MGLLTRVPLAMTIVAVAFGVAMGVILQFNEDFFKGRIEGGLARNPQVQSVTDHEVKEHSLYYQRYVTYSVSLGAATLAALLILGRFQAARKKVLVTQYILAFGGFLYPFFWLLMALNGPEMGREAAREAFIFLTYAGGLSVFGLLQTFFMALKYDASFVKPS